jgi:uncharacterized membrane protein
MIRHVIAFALALAAVVLYVMGQRGYAGLTIAGFSLEMLAIAFGTRSTK